MLILPAARLSHVLLVGFFVVAGTGAVAADASESDGEPTAAVAATWWPPMRNGWTPIAWKDHAFRFTVLFDGSIFCQPEGGGLPKPHLAKYKEEGTRLIVYPAGLPPISAQPKERHLLASGPGLGVGNQGWNERPTPMLWTDYRVSEHGYILRQEVFAHLDGGGDAKQGDEPLYAWIRFTVREVTPMNRPERIRFNVQIGGVDVSSTMNFDSNLRVDPARTRYPRDLAVAAVGSGDGAQIVRFVEPDTRVRLVAISRTGGITSSGRTEGLGSHGLAIELPAEKGAWCELLLPAIPVTTETIERELGRGFEGALKESDAFWGRKPAAVTRIETPERAVNEAIRASVKLAEMISEKNPETGEVAFLTGSWRYDSLWATPTAISTRMLDLLGEHDAVAKHLEIFKVHQGTVVPPGPAYAQHPGYYGTPKTLTAIDWLSDHGAILYSVAGHALMAGDRQFIAEWTPSIVRACEFIRDACAIREHDGIVGLPPAASATDKKVPGQALWSLAWTYKGLSTAVRLLEQISHPRAAEFRREANQFRATFVRAFREASAKAPRWTDAQGRTWPILPSSLSGEGPPPTHFFYVDTGALVLVWAELLEADDELMQAARAFFREGPNRAFYDVNNSHKQRPVLFRELSSGEPCYSYNVYHTWQLADRVRYFEGMYSLLKGAMSAQTFVTSETRHGISGMVVNPFVELVRRSVVDDEIERGGLHLLRLVPRAWLRTDFMTRFEQIPTEFGPVTIIFGLSTDGRTMEVDFRPGFRAKPARVVLHVPPGPIEAVRVNRERVAWNRDTREVQIP